MCTPWSPSRVQDVLGLDPELLAMTPRPVAAVILLFPCTERIYMERADEERWLQTQVQSEASSRAYHLEQVASFGNACGTIAAVHALSNTNLGAPGGLVLDGDSRLAAFCGETADQTAAQRGHKLVTSSHLKTESDEAAPGSLSCTTAFVQQSVLTVLFGS